MFSSKNAKKILDQISIAELNSSRKKGCVKLMAVSKNQDIDSILAAREFGLTHFGENRVQEAWDKFSDIKGVELNLIGHLQSNKVATSVGFFDRIDSVDSLSLAIKISKKAVALGIKQSILLQQNCSGEKSKSGFFSFENLLKNIETIRELPGLTIQGLMTIAPFSSSEIEIREAFSKLRNSFEKLSKQEGLSSMFELSMGMSRDFKIAIEEGSTLVRVGTALFGERHYV